MRRIFFCEVPPSKYSGGAAGLLRSGAAEFPPHPPSAAPSLGQTEFLAAILFFLALAPPTQCAGKVKQLPKIII